jgi:hypothetical protein
MKARFVAQRHPQGLGDRLDQVPSSAASRCPSRRLRAGRRQLAAASANHQFHTAVTVYRTPTAARCRLHDTTRVRFPYVDVDRDRTHLHARAALRIGAGSLRAEGAWAHVVLS